MKNYVEIFKALGNETRLRILYLIIKEKTPLCVCEISDSLKESQYNISRNLKILENTGLIKEEKKGRWKYFYISDKKENLMPVLFQTISHMENKMLEQDLVRLKERIKCRKNGNCVVGIKK